MNISTLLGLITLCIITILAWRSAARLHAKCVRNAPDAIPCHFILAMILGNFTGNGIVHARGVLLQILVSSFAIVFGMYLIGEISSKTANLILVVIVAISAILYLIWVYTKQFRQ